MLRHSVWTVVRYQSNQRTIQTPRERIKSCRYDSALVRFGEMAKIADADKMRKGKLDSAWLNGLGRPCGQVKSTFVVDNEGLHQVQSGETHSKRQPCELQC